MGKNLKGKNIGENITQRKDGLYQARYTDRFGNRKTLYNRNLRDLKDELREKQYEDSKERSLLNDKITLRQWFDEYMKIRTPQLADGTVSNYKTCYKRIDDKLGNKAMKDIKLVEFQKVFNNMPSDAARRNSKEILVAMYKYAVKCRILNNSLEAEEIECNLDKNKKPKRFLTAEEQKQITSICQHIDDGDFFEFALNTGMRVGEIAGLRWENINFDKNIIHVRLALKYVIDKYTGKCAFKLEKPKTPNAIRDIPMTTRAKEILLARKELNRYGNGEFDNLVFYTTSKAYFYTSTIHNIFMNILDKVKRSYTEFDTTDVVPHSLRHAFATRCVENGIDFKTLQRLMGHASINITLNLYCHVAPELLYDAIEKLEAGLNKNQISEDNSNVIELLEHNSNKVIEALSEIYNIDLEKLEGALIKLRDEENQNKVV